MALLCFTANAVALELSPIVDGAPGQQPAGAIGLASNTSVIDLKATLALKSDDGDTSAIPQVRMNFPLGDSVTVRSQMKLSDWNDGLELGGARLDTRFSFDSPTRFVKQWEARIDHRAGGVSGSTLIDFLPPITQLSRVRGSIQQNANGGHRYSLDLGFSGLPSNLASAAGFEIDGRAKLERVIKPDGVDSEVLAMEAVLSGLLSSDVAAQVFSKTPTIEEKFVLRFERNSGHQDAYEASLDYRRSWALSEFTKIRLVLSLDRAEDRTSPSLDIDWSARF